MTVGELQTRMSNKEYERWIAYYVWENAMKKMHNG